MKGKDRKHMTLPDFLPLARCMAEQPGPKVWEDNMVQH
jgi:hypothetical protein